MTAIAKRKRETTRLFEQYNRLTSNCHVQQRTALKKKKKKKRLQEISMIAIAKQPQQRLGPYSKLQVVIMTEEVMDSSYIQCTAVTDIFGHNNEYNVRVNRMSHPILSD